jgi:hypothetical protein
MFQVPQNHYISHSKDIALIDRGTRCRIDCSPVIVPTLCLVPAFAFQYVIQVFLEVAHCLEIHLRLRSHLHTIRLPFEQQIFGFEVVYPQDGSEFCLDSLFGGSLGKSNALRDILNGRIYIVRHGKRCAS